VRANGGTALYDATNTALGMLQGMDKAYAVVFSDGADSRELTGMGKGSDLTKAQVLEKIQASGVTVLTIGFGADHDPRILVEMSGASRNGAYFAAIEPESLDNAFARSRGVWQPVYHHIRAPGLRCRQSGGRAGPFLHGRRVRLHGYRPRDIGSRRRLANRQGQGHVP
jgi:hypothetical protein